MIFRAGQFALICAAVFAHPALAESAASYAGEYVMQGKGFGANDSAYTGTCSLQPQDHGYRVSCFNQDTRHTYVGKGLAQGDVLAVFIGDVLQGDHNATYAGEYLVLYQRKPDGSLAGTWLHTQSKAAGMETLTRKK
ncbi:MAG: hypothetical protein ACREUV_05760 [Burkholderiales bacterium]